MLNCLRQKLLYQSLVLLVLYFNNQALPLIFLCLKVKQQAGLSLLLREQKGKETHTVSWGEAQVLWSWDCNTTGKRCCFLCRARRVREGSSLDSQMWPWPKCHSCLLRDGGGSPALAPLWCGVEPGAGRLLVRQEVTAPSTQLGGRWDPAGREGSSVAPSRCRQRGLREAQGSMPWRLFSCDLQRSSGCLHP